MAKNTTRYYRAARPRRREQKIIKRRWQDLQFRFQSGNEVANFFGFIKEIGLALTCKPSVPAMKKLE
jgi:hypothetical protein